MEPVTTGISGAGIRANGKEEYGVFRLELRTDFVAQQGQLTLTSCDLTGKHPADVLPGLRVAAAFHVPNGVRFAPPYGPITGPADPLPGSIDLGLRQVLPVIEALAVIQDHTTEQIMIPDLTTVSWNTASELIRLAHLMQKGSVAVEWNEFDVEIPEGTLDGTVTMSGPTAPLSFQRPCVLRLDGRDIELGSVQYDMASARVESATSTEDGALRLRFVPGEDRTAMLVYGVTAPPDMSSGSSGTIASAPS
jgi:hypothetical protein